MLNIPKIFHHIWLGSAPLPQHFEQWLAAWQEMNPGWTVMRWTDTELPTIHNTDAFMKASKMAMKSDILRYEVCYQYGGVYIDADFEPLKPIEPILEHIDCFIADEREDTPCNAILGSVPGHGFMKTLIDELPASIERGGDIVDQTGPRFVKHALGMYLGNEYQKREDLHSPIGKDRYLYASKDGKKVYIHLNGLSYIHTIILSQKRNTMCFHVRMENTTGLQVGGKMEVFKCCPFFARIVNNIAIRIH